MRSTVQYYAWKILICPGVCMCSEHYCEYAYWSNLQILKRSIDPLYNHFYEYTYAVITILTFDSVNMNHSNVIQIYSNFGAQMWQIWKWSSK